MTALLIWLYVSFASGQAVDYDEQDLVSAGESLRPPAQIKPADTLFQHEGTGDTASRRRGLSSQNLIAEIDVLKNKDWTAFQTAENRRGGIPFGAAAQERDAAAQINAYAKQVANQAKKLLKKMEEAGKYRWQAYMKNYLEWQQYLQIKVHDMTRLFDDVESQSTRGLEKLQMQTGEGDTELQRAVELNDKYNKQAFQGLFAEQDGFQKDVEHLASKLNAITLPFFHGVKLSTEKAKSRSDWLRQKQTVAKTELESKMAYIKKIHKGAFERIGGLTARYEVAAARATENVERIPTLLEDKLGILESMADVEREKQTETLGSVRDNAASETEKTKSILAKVSHEMKDAFGDIQHESETTVFYRVLQFLHDVDRYQEESGSIIAELRGFAEDENARTSREALKVEAKLDYLSGELLGNSGKEKSFPPEADAAIANVQAVITEAAAELLPLREQMQKDMLIELKRAGDKDSVSGQDDAKQRLNSLVEAGSRAVSTHSAALERAIIPAIAVVESYTRDLDTAADGATKLQDQILRKTTELQALGKDLLATEEDLPVRLMKNTAVISGQARSTAASGRAEIRLAAKSMKAAKEQVVNDEVKETKALRKKLIDAITSLHTSVVKNAGHSDTVNLRLDTSGEKMLKTMEIKRASVERAMNSLEHVTMPEISRATNAYILEAKAEVKNMTKIMTDTFAVSRRAAEGSISMLKDQAGAVNDEVLEAVQSANEKNSKRVEDLKRKNTDLVTALTSDAETGTNKATLALRNAEETNEANKEGAYAAGEAVENVIDGAEDRVKKQGQHLQTELDAQKVAISQAELGLRNKITAASNQFKSQRDRASKTVDSTLTNANQQLLGEAESYTSGVDKEATRIIEQLHLQGKALGPQARTMELILEEVRKRMDSTKTLDNQALELKNGVNNAASDASAATSAYERHVAAKKAALLKTEAQVVDGASAEIKEGMSDAVMDADKEVASGKSAVNKASSDTASAIAALQASSAVEIKSANSNLATLAKKVAAASDRQAKTARDLLERVDAIATDRAVSEKKFSTAMRQQQRQVDQMRASGDERIIQVADSLSALTTSVQDTTKQQSDRDIAAVTELIQHAATTGSDLVKNAGAATRAALKYTNQFHPLIDDARNVLEQGEQALNAFTDDWRQQRKSIFTEVNKASIDRKQRVDSFRAQSEERNHLLEGGMQAGKHMSDKVEATVEYDLGHIDADAAKLDRVMNQMVGVEKMADDEAIIELRKRTLAATDVTEKLAAQQLETERDSKNFQTNIAGAFRSIGEDLDLGGMELAKEKAMEQWAVKRQMSKLAGVFAQDLKDVSHLAQQRLQELSGEMGKAIMELYNDKTLSADVRAKKLAELDKRMRDNAASILDEDARLKVDQATAVRNLKISADEIKQAMARVVQVEEASPASYNLENVLKRIQTAITDASVLVDSRSGLPSRLKTNETTAASKYGTDNDESEGGDCCEAATAECFACRMGISKTAYCSGDGRAHAVGCGGDASATCCEEKTAHCMSCQLACTEEEYCHVYQSAPGCPEALVELRTSSHELESVDSVVARTAAALSEDKVLTAKLKSIHSGLRKR